MFKTTNITVLCLLLSSLNSAAQVRPTLPSAESQVDIKMLERLQITGLRCDTNPIEKREIELSSHTEYWYISDGSCYFRNVDGIRLLEMFERGRRSLLNIQTYASFRHLLGFWGIDYTSGRTLTTPEFTSSPFHAFLAVKGLEIFGTPLNAFTYFIENTLVPREMTDLKDFRLNFKTVKEPRGFRAPRINALLSKKLTNVIGMWYLNSDGYVRYFTAADFKMDLGEMAEELARGMLKDTLSQFSGLMLSEDR